MAEEIELERTYLAKYLPEGLAGCESKEVIDIYIPKSERHPNLRVRKYGDRFMITKKRPVAGGDASEQLEETIQLTREEFESMSKLDGKRLRKIRYFYDYEGKTAEIGVFKDDLDGLVEVDFEFKNAKEKNAFGTPEFCLVDVTHEEFLAGGMLCGKKYSDIEKDLKRFNYSRIYAKQ